MFDLENSDLQFFNCGYEYDNERVCREIYANSKEEAFKILINQLLLDQGSSFNNQVKVEIY